MMKQEFEKLAGYEVSQKDYDEIIEPMYMAVELSKVDFVKLIDKKRFALPTKGEMKKMMRKLADTIFKGCGLTTYIDEDERLQRLAEEYAERFYGVTNRSGSSYVIVTRDYAYCGVRQDRGCTFPEEVIIGRDGYEYERIILIA